MPKPTGIMLSLHEAALDAQPVAGYTHNYYRYPARFSPRFASTAITEFTDLGDLVVDPFVGGGTTLVEAMVTGRRAVGGDLNSLATFVARVKTTLLFQQEIDAIRAWLPSALQTSGYRRPRSELLDFLPGSEVRNFSSPKVKALKKTMASVLVEAESLPSQSCREFVRCLMLRVGQWALDGRRVVPGVGQFREKSALFGEEMLAGMIQLGRTADVSKARPTIINSGASQLRYVLPFATGTKTRLILTSPPYVGVHVLYHRWQIDGRRETSAPYWLAGCSDGEFASFYTSGSRTPYGKEHYFDNIRETFANLREIVEAGGHVVQLVAFADPACDLYRYLDAMDSAGFKERAGDAVRTWRNVPNRKWHASQRGATEASREVVLVHEAV